MGVGGRLCAEGRSGGLEAWAWRDGAAGRGGVDDPHAVGACGAEFCDGVGEGTDWVHVEYGVGVLSVVEAAFGEDNRDEMNAAGAEKGDRRAVCEQLRSFTSTFERSHWAEEQAWRLLRASLP